MCLNVWLYTQSQAEPWTPATGQRRESAPPVWVRKVQGLTHCHMPCASSLDCRSKPCTPNGKSPSTSPCPWCLTSMVEAKPEAASDQRTKDPPNNRLSQVKSPKGKTDIHPSASRCNEVQPSTTKHNQVHQHTLTSHLEGLISHPFIEYCLMAAKVWKPLKVQVREKDPPVHGTPQRSEDTNL